MLVVETVEVKVVEPRVMVEMGDTYYDVTDELPRASWSLREMADLWFDLRKYRIEGMCAVALDGDEALEIVERPVVREDEE